MTRDDWHTVPKDDAWKRVTLSQVASLGQRIWIKCNGCGHDQIVEPLAFAAFHGLDEGTPLLSISPRLVCTACGAHKAHCWPEPYSINLKNSLTGRTGRSLLRAGTG